MLQYVKSFYTTAPLSKIENDFSNSSLILYTYVTTLNLTFCTNTFSHDVNIENYLEMLQFLNYTVKT